MDSNQLEILRCNPRSFDHRRGVGSRTLSFEDHKQFTLEQIQLALSLVQWNGARITESSLFDARQGPATAKQLANEWRFLGSRRVFVDLEIVRVRHSRSDGHYALRIETKAHIEQIP